MLYYEQVLPKAVGGYALSYRGATLWLIRLSKREYIGRRVRPMVSYPDLIQFVIMLTAFATFIVKLCKRK